MVSDNICNECNFWLYVSYCLANVPAEKIIDSEQILVFVKLMYIYFLKVFLQVSSSLIYVGHLSCMNGKLLEVFFADNRVALQ